MSRFKTFRLAEKKKKKKNLKIIMFENLNFSVSCKHIFTCSNAIIYVRNVLQNPPHKKTYMKLYVLTLNI